MIKFQWKSALLIAMTLLLGSCNAENRLSTEEPEGTVMISVVDLDESVASTRISTADLSLRIENTRAEVLKKWDKIADVPAQIRVVTGSYKLVAWSGDTSLFPSFTEMYYEGESKFAVAAGEEVSVPLTVKVGVSKVKVEFDAASFANYYSDYSADIRTTTPTNPDARFLNFTQSTTDVANFMPGTLRIRMRMTSKVDGKEYFFYPSPITGMKAAEIRTVTLKVVTTSGTNSLVVTTDDGYEKVEDIILELPGSAMPKQAPVIRANSFAVGGVIAGTEGYVPTTKYAATIVAQGGIQSVKISTTSPVISALWGGLSQIELVGASAELRNRLTAVGFIWDEALNTAETAAVKYGRTEISLSRMFGALTAQAGFEYTEYPFEIEVVDMFNQSNKNIATAEGRFNFVARVGKPNFGYTVAPTTANVWSLHAEFDIKYSSNTQKVPEIWVKEGEGAWVRSGDQKFEGIIAEEAIGVQSVYGLKPATAYTFRLMMGDHAVEEFAATTEPLAEVENGGMENWRYSWLDTSPHDIPYYQPYAAGGNQNWISNNDRTTSYRLLWMVYGYNSFPAVSVTNQVNSGDFAAEIRTTSASNINPLNTTSITQGVSQTTGRLFIGTYSFQNSSDVIKYGKPFASRPSTMSFYHTYEPYESDSFDAEVIIYNGETVIGSGKFVSSTKVDGSYQKVDVNITYTNRRLRADAMAIAFRSSTGTPAVRKVNGVDLFMPGYSGTGNKGWSVWLGSKLRIDDVSVSY